MRVGIVRFPGSNCDTDVERAVRAAGGEPVWLWHGEGTVGGAEAVILPGGFSYGDYLRAGAIARLSPVMRAVTRFAAGGGPVLGICNGFQVLCEARLLPGALARNAGLRFRCHPVRVRVETVDTPFTSACVPGRVLQLPIAHGEGRYVADSATLRVLEAERRVVLRYVDQAGEPTEAANPNGSLHNIAGVCGEDRNVVGVMPHPERAVSPLLGSTNGIEIFRSLIGHVIGTVS